MLLHQRLRLDILPKVSKFLGARTGDTQTDKSLKRWGGWTLTGPAMLQPLACLVLHSMFFLKKQHCSSHPRGGCSVPCVFTLSPFPSHQWSSSSTSPSSQSCAEPSPLPAAGDGLAQSGCSGPLFPQQPHRQDGRSASLPGWAPSW